MTDSELLALFQARDERALKETETAYGNLCRCLAVRILGDRQDAEECVNDVLMKLWNAVPPLNPDNLRAYLAAVTRNLCFDRLSAANCAKRGRGQLPEVLEELSDDLASDENPESCLDRIALQDSISRFLKTLPHDNRMIFLARYWSFQPIAEIAAQHGSTVGRVKMILKRTKDKLKVHLEKEGLL
ncbi:MAG: sigma-70 family RNA polymerase sigma factor [Oscillospiraceae bacterium]|nr:sigma-70 family RNA polymerase sigma factor [Oscillospiraceae bacterium]